MKTTQEIMHAIERDFPGRKKIMPFYNNRTSGYDVMNYDPKNDRRIAAEDRLWMRYYNTGLIVCMRGKKPEWMGKELAYPIKQTNP